MTMRPYRANEPEPCDCCGGETGAVRSTTTKWLACIVCEQECLNYAPCDRMRKPAAPASPAAKE